LWARPNTSPGRWNTARSTPTQYFSNHPHAVWAELARQENLRSADEFGMVRTTIWAVNVNSLLIANYGTFGIAQAVGFPPDALVDDDHERCQREATRLQTKGFRGVLAPSAALPGYQSLTLFGARVRSEWGIAPLLGSSLACCRVAIGGPAKPLAGLVRHFGAPHDGYEAFVAAAA
jgi:RES domain-containing protein